MKKRIFCILMILSIIFSFSSCTAKKYVIATDNCFSPMCYVDEEGNATGFEVELIKLIAKTEKIHIDIIPCGLLKGLDALEKGDADAVLASIIPTDEFNEKYDFSDSYYHDYALAVNKGENSALIKKFNNGLLKIIENGKFKALADKYSLGDIEYE